MIGRAVRVPCCELCSAAGHLRKRGYWLGKVIRHAVRVRGCELCSVAANLQGGVGIVIRD